MERIKTKAIAEFGDFQTPERLAKQVCALLGDLGVDPAGIIEPTCGRGAFLFAAADRWPRAGEVSGLELNETHCRTAKSRAESRPDAPRFQIEQRDFFQVDWASRVNRFPDRPILVIGNPPWVTNAHVSSIGGSNLPVKSNFQGHNGFDAITGKANFDISEWMLIKLAETLNGRNSVLAMLVKTSVARKLLLHCWKNGFELSHASVYRIDAESHFDAAVDASLIVLRFGGNQASKKACVYGQLSRAIHPTATIALADNILVANLDAYERTKHLRGESSLKWRSGIKHDCSKVMELRRQGQQLRNGFGELVEIEPDYLFPMLKTSEVAGGKDGSCRYMLVPQRSIGHSTLQIEKSAPRTWDYLKRHRLLLEKRRSSIYRGKPEFSIFGVGEYTFAPWKIAISGMYKSLRFLKVGPYDGKPVVFDDTTNFMPCPCEASATVLLSLLESDIARQFYDGLVFWDAKRPITVEILGRLNLRKLAAEVGMSTDFERYFGSTHDRAAVRQRRPRKQFESPMLWPI